MLRAPSQKPTEIELPDLNLDTRISSNDKGREQNHDGIYYNALPPTGSPYKMSPRATAGYTLCKFSGLWELAK